MIRIIVSEINKCVTHVPYYYYSSTHTHRNMTYSQWETWAWEDAHNRPILAGMDDRHTCSSWSTALRCSLYLFLMQVKVKKLSSHKYVVAKGNNMSPALLDNIGYSFSKDIQNLSKVTSWNFIFSVQSSVALVQVARSSALFKAH